jgi:hypothetical protein
MIQIRTVIVSALFTMVAFSAVLYTSCKKNKCDKVVCLNLGTCDNGSCTCLVGFEGDRCQTLSRQKFIFTYNGGDSCIQYSHLAVNKYEVKLLAILSDSIEMIMKNFLGNYQDSAVCTIQSTDSFTFIGSNNSTNFTGWGKLSNDSLHMVYHVTHDTTSYDCRYFGQSLRR